jgi:hypothetical protein
VLIKKICNAKNYYNTGEVVNEFACYKVTSVFGAVGMTSWGPWYNPVAIRICIPQVTALITLD